MIARLWRRSSVRFASVGLINTFIDFLVLNILVFGFGIYKLWANVVSVSVAMSVSYLLNHTVVFRQKGQHSDHKRNIVLFITITAFGLFVLQNIVIYLFVHVITLPAIVIQNITNLLGFSFSYDFILLNTAKLAATVCTMIWNFLMYRKFVFTK